MEGWVRVWRKILDNPIWEDKPFSKGQAWIDLILLANHKDNQLLLGNTVVTIQRGQLHTSELNLSKRWGWSRKKTRAFLSLLDNQKMATSKGTTKGTTITIGNYSDYQYLGTMEDTIEGTMEEHQKNIKRTAQGTQTKNVKNGENEKNEKNEKKKDICRFAPPTVEEIKSYCLERKNLVDAERFHDFYESKGWLVGKTKMKDWKAAVRTWEKNDTTKPEKSRYREDDLGDGWNDVL